MFLHSGLDVIINRRSLNLELRNHKMNKFYVLLFLILKLGNAVAQNKQYEKTPIFIFKEEYQKEFHIAKHFDKITISFSVQASDSIKMEIAGKSFTVKLDTNSRNEISISKSKSNPSLLVLSYVFAGVYKEMDLNIKNLNKVLLKLTSQKFKNYCFLPLSGGYDKVFANFNICGIWDATYNYDSAFRVKWANGDLY